MEDFYNDQLRFASSTKSFRKFQSQPLLPMSSIQFIAQSANHPQFIVPCRLLCWSANVVLFVVTPVTLVVPFILSFDPFLRRSSYYSPSSACRLLRICLHLGQSIGMRWRLKNIPLFFWLSLSGRRVLLPLGPDRCQRRISVSIDNPSISMIGPSCYPRTIYQIDCGNISFI